MPRKNDVAEKTKKRKSTVKEKAYFQKRGKTMSYKLSDNMLVHFLGIHLRKKRTLGLVCPFRSDVEVDVQ